MNITYYPFKPFKIESGKVNVLDIGNGKMYFDICRGFSDLADTIKISNDDLEIQDCGKQCSWYGDLMLSVDLNKLFVRKIQQRLLELMNDEQQVALLDRGREVVSEVTDVSFLMDLPLEVSSLPDVEKIMKFVGISFPSELAGNPYAILETLIQTHVELGIKKKLVLTNVSHYISKQQFHNLSHLVSDLNVTVVDIEFSETSRAEKFVDACYYYVDEDFVDWRSTD